MDLNLHTSIRVILFFNTDFPIWSQTLKLQTFSLKPETFITGQSFFLIKKQPLWDRSKSRMTHVIIFAKYCKLGISLLSVVTSILEVHLKCNGSRPARISTMLCTRVTPVSQTDRHHKLNQVVSLSVKIHPTDTTA